MSDEPDARLNDRVALEIGRLHIRALIAEERAAKLQEQAAAQAPVRDHPPAGGS